MVNGIGKRVELAQLLIVRYIWDQGLKRGDRLPSCATIARDVHLGEATVFRAVKRLQEEGVLKSQDKVGVFVADPRTPGLAGYHVGVLMGRADTVGYMAPLSGYIQNALSRNGCRSMVFHGEIGDDSSMEDTLELHVGVKQCIERGEIQGLMLAMALSEENWNYLRERNIPACYVGGFPYLAAPLAATLSLKNVLDAGLKRLLVLGKRRPALFLPKLDTESEAMRIFKCLTGTLTGFDPEQYCFHYSGVSEGRALAVKILSIPKDKRPDGILFLDHYLALHFYSILLRQNKMAYLPHPVVLCAKEELFWLPLETDLLEFQMSEISRCGVNLLLKALRASSFKEERVEFSAKGNFIRIFSQQMEKEMMK